MRGYKPILASLLLLFFANPVCWPIVLLVLPRTASATLRWSALRVTTGQTSRCRSSEVWAFHDLALHLPRWTQAPPGVHHPHYGAYGLSIGDAPDSISLTAAWSQAFLLLPHTIGGSHIASAKLFSQDGERIRSGSVGREHQQHSAPSHTATIRILQYPWDDLSICCWRPFVWIHDH